jgi:hypothetical protein
MESCCDVGAATRKRETAQIARSFLPGRLLDQPVQFIGVDRRKGLLLIVGDIDLSHADILVFPAEAEPLTVNAILEHI